MTAVLVLKTSPEAPTSVYVRRRLAVGVILIIVGAAFWTLATWATDSSVGVAPAGADAPESTQVYIVQPGDTLWSIAAEFNPDADVRRAVDRLSENNGGSAIAVGQRLRL